MQDPDIPFPPVARRSLNFLNIFIGRIAQSAILPINMLRQASSRRLREVKRKNVCLSGDMMIIAVKLESMCKR
jgi:hypothetical protein